MTKKFPGDVHLDPEGNQDSFRSIESENGEFEEEHALHEPSASSFKDHVHQLARSLSNGVLDVLEVDKPATHSVGEKILSTIQENQEDLLLVDLVGIPAESGVRVTRIVDNRVYFQNPSSSNVPRGTIHQMPPRRVEDPEEEIESMKFEDFKLFAVSLRVEKRE